MKRNVSFATTAAAAAAATAVVLWLAVPAGASPATGPAISGTEHLQSMTTSFTLNTRPVIAFGVFTTAGVDHITGHLTDRFVFPAGTFQVTHANGPVAQHLNPKTCLLSQSGRGPFKISDGTGKYAGISGHGFYHFSLLAILPRSGGKCLLTKSPVANAFQFSISGLAQVTL